jgi:hypothetical protein
MRYSATTADMTLVTKKNMTKNKKAEYTKKWRAKNAEHIRLYNEKNKERLALYRRKRYYEKRGELLAKQAIYREKNKEKILEASRKYREENREKMNEYFRKNRERRKEYRKGWYEKNKNKVNEYKKNRRKDDPNFKLAYYLRNRIRCAIKTGYKRGSAVKDLGCSIQELKIYLESKFDSKMNWDNWGQYGWHIDHIKSLSKFNLEDRREFLLACHYTNLQPLWWRDNISKYNH